MAKRREGELVQYAGHGDLARVDDMSLAELARRANECVGRGVQASLWHVACAGVYLLAAKKQVGHGGWLKWLDAHWHHGPSQAGRYMKIAEQCGRDPSRVSALDATTVRGALALLGAPVDRDRGRSNSSRVTNSVVDADYVLRPDPEPANPPVKLASLDAPVTDIVEESKRAGAATAPGDMTSRVFSAPPPTRKPPEPPVITPRPMIVAVAPKWVAEVVPLLAAGLESYRKALALMGESRMQPTPIPNEDGYDIRFDTYEAQAVVLRRMVEAAEKDVRDWSRVAADTAKDEPEWIADAAARRRGEVVA